MSLKTDRTLHSLSVEKGVRASLHSHAVSSKIVELFILLYSARKLPDMCVFLEIDFHEKLGGELEMWFGGTAFANAQGLGLIFTALQTNKSKMGKKSERQECFHIGTETDKEGKEMEIGL